MKNLKSIQEKVEEEINRLSQKKRKEMMPWERVRLLQLKLYQKAKQEKEFKFYVLYDKLSLDYVLKEAYSRCRRNGGSAGVDGQTYGDVEKAGLQEFLQEIQRELRTRSYRPLPVKRVWIDKANGGKRPLGIPVIKDRVVQQACKLILEPIWEADFQESSYGFRPKRSASDAVKEIKWNLKSGKTEVYDADLSKYFDTIPHDKLELVLKQRISDPRILHLIRQWLKTVIVEEDGRYTGGKKSKRGTPQGGVISPLLANIYMNLLDRIIEKANGYFCARGIKIIRYADDFILMSRRLDDETIDKVKGYLTRMGLSINAEKSKLVKAKEESFDFLGFTFRYDRSIYGKGRRYWRVKPSAKSEKKIRQNINARLKRISHYPAMEVVAELNPILRGWMNYYRIEKVSYTQVSFKKLDSYLRERLRRYYNRKSQRKSSLHGQEAYQLLVKDYGLIVPYKASPIRPAYAHRRK